MKTTPSLILLLVLFVLYQAGVYASPDEMVDSGMSLSEEISDSIPLARSQSEKADKSFFDGIIPPSPQAAALARYAEYPVSMSTGIPDISIPLYEIDLGGFTLPLSISYHASGARVDDIPTCVGLGWVLNAGGAVTRTIMGAPDLWTTNTYDTDYSFRDIATIRRLATMDADKSSERDTLRRVLESYDMFDSESDRYTYNVGGKAGPFRYSHRERRFVSLEHDNFYISASGTGYKSRFYIASPDGNHYVFGTNERSGLDFKDEGKSYTSAWYLDTIATPYGKILFKYKSSALSFSVNRFSITTEGGEYPQVDESKPPFLYEVRSNTSESRHVFDQVLLEEIEWNGNKVRFNYSVETAGFTPYRLDSMTVRDASGNLRKTVRFRYETWASAESKQPGREMLKSVEDSEAGSFSFSYNGIKGGEKLPSWNTGSDTATRSDLWGYYNSSEISTYVLPETVAEDVSRNFDYVLQLNHPCASRDRSCKLDKTLLGVLNEITFPTGGKVRYNYELNSGEWQSQTYTAGGLRVKSIETSDGSRTHTKTYAYTGFLTQDPPERRMVCRTVLYWGNVPPCPPVTYRKEFKTAYSYPIGYTFAPSSPVVYHTVVETRSDGSRTEYKFDCGGTTDIYIERGYEHPSVCRPSLEDLGNRTAQLKSKKVYDSRGNAIYEETNEYLEKEVCSPIVTGVRLHCYMRQADFMTGSRFLDTSKEIADPYNLTYTEVTAKVRVRLLSSRTETDLRTGFSKTTGYSYDRDFRTIQPKTMSITGSDGIVHTTEYTYPFDHDDTVSQDMVFEMFTDFPVEENVYCGDSRIATKRYSYRKHDGFYYPITFGKWSMPTKDIYTTADQVPSVLPEKERVSEYNRLGRPLSIKVNETDETTFSWNSTGDLLLSSTAPGGFTTTYTHKPLFGLESVTQPNGLKTRYEYNSMGNLSRVFVNLACTDTYDYSIANHPDVNYNSKGNSVISRHYLTQDGLVRTVDQQFYDGLGRPSVLAKAGANTSGKYLYSAVTYDNLGRELRNIMPATGGNSIEEKKASEVLTMTAATYGDSYAYSESSYDALDRPVKVTTPGQAWHDAGEKGKITEYVGNAANSVRLYSAPMGTISLVENGYYAASTLQGVRTIDEDGNEMTVYTDRLGRKVLERRGPESAKGKNDTYFVYNDLGQLRYVLSPGYELSGYKDKFAYEYRYDEHGNVVKKFIPGGGYTQYWYDRAGRMTFMQDENLRSQNLHRFFIYDRAGRQALQGTTAVCTRSSAVNFADYTGGTSGFQSTGYTLQDAARIQQVTLETVNYYDDYRFASALDSRLVQTTSVSAKGLGTGSVTYNSEGGKSMSAIYYDIRGNVTSLREITDFGTLRVTDNTYTFTNQPLTTKMTESGGVTMLTENTYDTNSGLLVATDVTVNGVKQRVSKVTYDDLGRIASVVRGNGSNSGGTVSYSYNLHGQTTAINGPGFTQKLHYTDGPGKPLYNGSISSMLWTMGSDATQRGYKYTYNGYNWLTLAEYGEGATLSTHRDRYTERFSEFMLNGGIRRLQRHGLKADGNYGKIDNLHISYNGNRITTVLEDADPVTQSGSMDYPGAKREMEFGYNDWGALVSDESRGIKAIEYDSFGNPVHIKFSGRDYTKNVYSATGVKLATEHYTHPLHTGPIVMGDEPQPNTEAANAQIGPGIISPEHHLLAGQQKIEYRGPVIYRNFKIDMVLFPGGYATIGNDNAVTFHYYTQDYLGNNRAVVNGSTGAVEQTTAYYPYGAVIPDLGTGNDGQPFKFGGKELVSANGLNAFDFGARLHYPAIPQFDRIDPMCEKFAWLSPYLYCANNPVNLIDLNGEIPNEYESALMCGYVYHDDNFEEYAEALERTKWKVSLRKVSIVKNQTGTLENGLQSELFERTIDGVTEYAYVFAGTNSFEDVLEDVGQLFGIAPQYSNAIENARALDKELKSSELTFLGHSLGGGLSAASSMATGRNAITFNRASVSGLTSFFNNLGDVSKIRDYVIINHNTKTGNIKEEPLSRIQQSLSIHTKARQFYIYVHDMNHIKTHSIKTVVDALGKYHKQRQ